jgi:aspartate/tyrosine/aromatic aminotransferase
MLVTEDRVKRRRLNVSCNNMKCKHCGGDIKQSGDVWIADLSLEDKAYIMRWNGFTLDNYRYFSIFCNFDNEGHSHLPDEAEEVKQILNDYKQSNKNRSARR